MVPVLALAALLATSVLPALASGWFVDDDGSPFEEDIEAVADAEITQGCDPPQVTRFCPGEQVTRGQVAAFLDRALDLPASPTDHFDDDDGTLFEDAINAVAEAEITQGCGRSGTRRFCPRARVTRAQLAAFLDRGLGLPAASTDHFVDDDGLLLEDAINAVAEERITRGCNPPDNTRFCPSDLVPRGQVAALLARALQLTPPGAVPLHAPPDEEFAFTSEPVAGHPTVEDRVVGSSWRSGCPVDLDDLRYLRLSYVGFDGQVRTGELVVHRGVVSDVRTAMRRTFEAGFPIRQMRLVDDFGADDGRSMRANNTSAFNCRKVAGTNRWSNHATGRAIDVNPLRNPYVHSDGRTDPPEGAAYADRSDRRPGMLYAGTEEVEAWRDLGWDWGGTWSSARDYQHFSADGG